MIFDGRNFLRKVKRRTWIYLICILLPVILSPLAISSYKEAKCAYVVLLVGFYWLMEPAHVAATALLPIILFPILGVVSSRDICNNYMTETFMMFIGGLIVAAAVEDSKLHERIALKILLMIGTEFKWLMMGFMLITMFMSMWISNMSTTAMMVPIVEAIIEEIATSDGDIEMADVNEQSDKHKAENNSVSKNKIERRKNIYPFRYLNKRLKFNSYIPYTFLYKDCPESTALPSVKIALLLSICYAANIGGTGSLIGCAANMVLKGFIEDQYPESSEITFASWLMYNIPGMLLCAFIAWIYLWTVYIRSNKRILKIQSERNIKEIISKRYDDMPPMTSQEIQVLVLFLILVSLWVFRDPKFIPGWAIAIGSDTKIGDSFPAILIAFLLFFLPADPRHIGGRPILEWKTAQNSVPWGVIILVGGGFALADAAQKSGLSKLIGSQLSVLSVLPPAAIVAVLCFMTAMVTEIMSNTATATILLPVISEMATSMEVNPLYLMMPVIIACSYAFMLPVATPPNALVFESGKMRSVDMAKPGLVMNLVCCANQLLLINTLGVAMFDLKTFPNWANKTNNINSNGTMEDFVNTTFFTNSITSLDSTS